MPLGYSLGFPLPVIEFLTKIWDQLKHLRRPEPRIEKLKEANDELEAKAADINSSISQAEREGQIPSNQIQLWVSKVIETKRKVEATEKDFDRMRCLCGCSWNCFLVNRRVAKRVDEINELKTGVNDTPVAKEPPPPAVVQIPTANSIVGMGANTKEILDHIANPDAGVIGVYGMGGVGKTTLLSSINNHKDVATKFDHVIWAIASREYKMERLQMDIAKRLKLRLHEDDREKDRAAKLFDFLKNKHCLLLLDDLWEPLDLAMLGMAHATLEQGEQKRKVVVFTTRDEQVCGDMKANRKMEIKCLGPEQAWDLFRMNAGEDAIGSDVGIDRIARQIAEECAGLPLALITVGKAMSTKKSSEAWNDTLTLMNHSQTPKVTGKKKIDPMFSAFKLSYDYLEDEDMRGCLLSCALWPEDFPIYKRELIECWMGLGLINEVDAIHKAFNRGHSHIETLKAACLLELDYNEDMVKMHDVIRDMALWMASDCGTKKFKWIVRAGVGGSQALKEKGWHETERVSLMYSDITSLPNQLSSCSKLSMLMLQWNEELKEIDGSFIQAMHSLTYLDLENTGITEIPKEIGMLSQLMHLNLSGTPIKELPTQLGHLVKLNYLLLRRMGNLTVVAKGGISNLSSLKLLDLRESVRVDWWDELASSKGCQISIGINIITAVDLQRLSSLANVSAWRINMEKLSDLAILNLDNIMMSRNIRHSMEELHIVLSKIDKILISAGNKEAGAFECLKFLYLKYLDELEEITWKRVQPQMVFPILRKLDICMCRRLRNMNWIMQLPSLSVLFISRCDNMEELISDEGYSSSSSSSFGLKRMRLSRMPILGKISPRPLNFPYLEEIEVLSCPFLMKLPFENQISVNKLKVIYCEQTWWDNLEWEKVSTKDSLSPLVKCV